MVTELQVGSFGSLSSLHSQIDWRRPLSCQAPSGKFLEKSVKVMIWDLALFSNFFELLGTNFYLGRPGLACPAAYNCLAGTKKLLPAVYAAGYNFRCQHLTTASKGRS